MVVDRWTWPTKRGYRQEFLEATRALFEANGFAGRFCTHKFGPYDVVTWYYEFVSLEDQQKAYAAIDWSRPELAELVKKHFDLSMPGSIHEVLQVH